MNYHRDSQIAGYTLIEILIVLFIISIVTSVALLSIGQNENRRLESFANDFAQVMTLAEEQAMLQPSVLGLTMKNHSYQFAAYEPAPDQKKPVWKILQDNVLGTHTIPSDIEVGIEIGGNLLGSEDEEKNNGPQVIISTNGDITPFVVYVGKRGEKPRYVIRGDADGNVSKKMLS